MPAPPPIFCRSVAQLRAPQWRAQTGGLAWASRPFDWPDRAPSSAAAADAMRTACAGLDSNITGCAFDNQMAVPTFWVPPGWRTECAWLRSALLPWKRIRICIIDEIWSVGFRCSPGLPLIGSASLLQYIATELAGPPGHQVRHLGVIETTLIKLNVYSV